MFESVRFVALDINGTLIDGMYHPWSEVLEKRLGLRRRGDAVRLRLNEVQTGKISFEEAVSSMYVVEDFEGLRAVAFERYMADLRLRNGCIELLEALRRRYKLVVCSDTTGVTKAIAKRFNLEKYFCKAFYSVDVGWMKSDREFWDLFLSSLSGRPEESVMIGDNPRCDIHWPNVLGMGTIQIKTTENLSERDLAVVDEHDKPDYYVKNLREVADILLGR